MEATSRLVDRAVSGVGAPLGAAFIGIATAVAAYAYQPGKTSYCPFNAATGLYCPGCGATRALHALTHGDLVAALHNNMLFVIAIPIVIYVWAALLSERLGRAPLPMPRIGRRSSLTIACAVALFFMARNIGVDAIAPIAVQ